MAWDQNQSLDVLADKTEEAYFEGDWGSLQALPPSVIENCWKVVETDPLCFEAGKILHRRFHGGFEASGDVNELCEMVRLLNVIYKADVPMIQDIGHTLLMLLNSRLQESMAEKQVCIDLLRENPIDAIEKAFFDVDNKPENILVGGLLMAGYRGMSFGNPELARLTLAFGLREVYAFYRSGRCDLAELSMETCDWHFSRLKKGLNKADRDQVGKLLFSAALGAEMGGFFDDHLRLLKRAKAELCSDEDTIANCMWYIGKELQRRHETVEAMEAYEEGLSRNVSNAQLKAVIEASIATLRADMEGSYHHLFKTIPSTLELLGMDGSAFKVLQRIAEKLDADEPITEDDNRKVISDLEVVIDHSISSGSDPDNILALHNLMFKATLQLGDAAVLKTQRDLFIRADSFCPNAKPGTVLQYKQLKQHLGGFQPNKFSI